MYFNLIVYGFCSIRDVSAPMHPPGEQIVVFFADKARSNEPDETFTGNLNVYDELHTWVTEKCVPLVREITFENAEELTEEGIPFLILFHKPEDNESVKKFNDVVRNELMSEKSKFLSCTNTCLHHV
jgi:endoplasmic reticulum resident protein 44